MLSPSDVKLLKEIFVVKEEFNKFRDQVMTMFDKVMKELLAIREENAIFKGRIYDHEEKIEVLEKIHPQSRHAS